MPRYKLLKDLPGCAAGTVGTTRDHNRSFCWFSQLAYPISFMDSNPSFFQRLPDEPPAPKVECWSWIPHGDTEVIGADHVKVVDGVILDAVGPDDDGGLEWARRNWNGKFRGSWSWASETPAEYDAAKAEAEARKREASKPKVERRPVVAGVATLIFMRHGVARDLHTAADLPDFAGYEYDEHGVTAYAIMFADREGDLHTEITDQTWTPVRPVAVLFGKE